MDINRNIFRLEHVIESIEKIEFILSDLTYGQYLEDWIKQDAIVKNIQVIGEAIAHVDEELKEKYPDVSWKQAKGMRNILIHEYFRIEYEEVWKTLGEDLPKLKFQILAIISALQNS